MIKNRGLSPFKLKECKECRSRFKCPLSFVTRDAVEEYGALIISSTAINSSAAYKNDAVVEMIYIEASVEELSRQIGLNENAFNCIQATATIDKNGLMSISLNDSKLFKEAYTKGELWV